MSKKKVKKIVLFKIPKLVIINIKLIKKAIDIIERAK